MHLQLQNHHEVQQDGILFPEEEQETTLHSAITHQEEGHEYSSLQRFTSEVQRSQYPDQEGRRGSGEGSVLFKGYATISCRFYSGISITQLCYLISKLLQKSTVEIFGFDDIHFSPYNFHPHIAVSNCGKFEKIVVLFDGQISDLS